ncbi:MAG: PstC family ABC transporter permease, partial [Sphingomonas sp.]
MTLLFVLTFGLGMVAWLVGRARAGAFVAGPVKIHSLAGYHGAYVALWTVLPALLLAAVWTGIAPGFVTQRVIDSPAGVSLPADPDERRAILSEARGLAQGELQAAFNPLAETLAPEYKSAHSQLMIIGLALCAILAFAGGAFAFTRVKPEFRARTRVERAVTITLLVASLIAILTTIGIVASLLFETIRFFGKVGVLDFLFGTRWSPQAASGGDMKALGAIPLFWGTIFIGAIIAMIVAIPLGLMSAIYLTQYAGAATRRWMKPLLEILAGVPTVVYGYFAALTVAPIVRAI